MADDPRHLYSEPHGDPGYAEAPGRGFDSGSHGRGLNGHESVGALLRRTRESFSYDLRFVSDSLRIRYVYLDAIERGQYDALPGPTYAVGFVRSYADFLGLNDDDVVRRFKDEVHGIDGTQHLHFPEPVNEAKVPGGAVLLVSLVLIAAAYGGWHFLSGQDRTFSDFVPAVPERLMALIDGGGEGDSPAPVETAAVPPETAQVEPGQPEPGQSEPGQSEGELAERSQAEPVDVRPVVDDATQASDLIAAVLSSETAASSPANALQVDETADPPEAAPVAGGAPESEADAAASEPASEESATPAPTAPAPASAVREEPAIPAAPAQEQTAAVEAGRVFGADNADSRITLRAMQDSWVQVRGADNSLLLTRVLNPGDIYRVPNRSGLVLHTGNAGGLEVVIDGDASGTLGTAGQVRRNIPLEPASLGE